MVSTPAETPVTTPELLIVAIAGNTLLQVPPAVESLNVIVLPTQTSEPPVIGANAG
jgi:hypothetical protein